MSNVPFPTQYTLREAPGPSDISSPTPREIQTDKGAWHKLLRPLMLEKLILVADVLVIVATGAVCSAAYLWATTESLQVDPSFVGVGFVVAANFATVMTARGNYQLKHLVLAGRQIRDALVVWTCVYGVLAFVAFAMKVSHSFSRVTTVLFFASGLVLIVVWRAIAARLLSQALAKGLFARKKVIVIAEQNLNLSSRPLTELQRYGYMPVRTFEVTPTEIGSIGVVSSLRSKLTEAINVARSEHIEDIYLVIRWQHLRTISGILDALAVLPVSVHLVPDEGAARFLNHPVANVGNTWTAVLRRAPLTYAELRAKRCLDLMLAVPAFVLLLPLMLLTAALIKLDSRGPILFVQKRNGFNGHAFKIFKFRTMNVLEDGPVVLQARRDDPRVTRLGRWLRMSSIDELPQLINVIRGEMSLVGPRPHAVSHDSRYEELIANYAFRQHVKPGLTGWAQVNGCRGETQEVEQMRLRVEHDLWYINNWSLLLDLQIIARTLFVALRQSAY